MADPFDYQFIYNMFQDAQSRSPEVLGDMSVAEYARTMNQSTASNLFDQALNSGVIKETSAGLSRAIESTGAATLAGNLMEFGSSFLPEAIRPSADFAFETGYGTPRGLVNFAPMIAGGLAAPFTGGSSLVPFLATAGSAALSGADTYTQTGSAGMGMVSALSVGLLPGVTRYGEGLVHNAVKDRIANQYFQRAATYAGGQVAAGVDFELARMTNEYLGGGEVTSPFTKENLFGSVVTQMPWVIADLPRVIRNPTPFQVATNIDKTSTKNQDANVGNTSQPNPSVDQQTPPTQSDVGSKLAAIQEASRKKAEVNNRSDITPEKKKELVAEVDSMLSDTLTKATKDKQGESVFFGEPLQSLLDGDSPTHEALVENANLVPASMSEAVSKITLGNKTLLDLGLDGYTDHGLQTKIENDSQVLGVNSHYSFTEVVEKSVQSVANEAVQKKTLVDQAEQKKSQRQVQKEANRVRNHEFMAEQEKVPTNKEEFQVVQQALERAATLNEARANDYPDIVANVYYNYKQQHLSEPNVPRLRSALHRALENATTAKPIDRLSLKKNGKFSKSQGGRGNNTRELFSWEDANRIAEENQSRYESSLPAAERGKTGVRFDVEHVSGDRLTGKYSVVRYEFELGQSLFDETFTGSSGATQLDLDSHNRTTVGHNELQKASIDPKADPDLKAAAAVGKADVDDMVLITKNLDEDSLFDILGFGTKENPTTSEMVEQFRQRAIVVFEHVARGELHPDLIGIEMERRGVGFEVDPKSDINPVQEFINGEQMVLLSKEVRDQLLNAPALDGVVPTITTPEPIKTETFGMQWFSKLGFTGPELTGLNEGLSHITQLFRDLGQVQIGELINNNVRGWFSGLTVFREGPQFPAEVYLANMPESYGTAKQRSYAEKFTLAHELNHVLERQFQNGNLSTKDIQTINRLVDFLDDLPEADRRALMKDVITELIPSWARTRTLSETLMNAANDGAETRANIMGAVATAIAESRVSKVREFIDFFPKPVGDVIKTVIRFGNNIVSAINGADYLSSFGLMENISGGIKNPLLKELVKDFRSLTAEVADVQRVTNEFMRLERLEPQGFHATQIMLAKNPLSTLDFEVVHSQRDLQNDLVQAMFFKPNAGTTKFWEDTKSSFKDHSNTFLKHLMPAFQFAEMTPEVKGVVIGAKELTAYTNEAVSRSLDSLTVVLNPENGKFEKNSKLAHANLVRLENTKSLRDKFNAIQRWQNENDNQMFFDANGNPANPDLVAGLSQKDLNLIRSVNAGVALSNKENQITLLRSEQENAKIDLATVIQRRNPSWRVEESKKLADAFFDAKTQLVKDPNAAVRLQPVIDHVVNTLGPDTYMFLDDFANQQIAALDKLENLFNSSPGFTSERRFQKYRITYIDANGERAYVDHGTRTQHEAAQERITAAGGILLKEETPDSPRPMGGLNQSTISALDELNALRRQQLELELGPDEFARIEHLTRVEDDLTRALAARDVASTRVRRRLASGREELDMLHNAIDFTEAAIHSAAKKTYRKKAALELMDPGFEGREDLKSYAIQHMEGFLAPDTDAGRAITQGNFLFFLGGNTSSAIMESMQSLFTLVPALRNEGMGIIQSYKALKKGVEDLTTYHTTGKFKNPEHERVMKLAEKDLGLQLGAFSELTIDESMATALKRKIQGNSFEGVKDIVKKPLGQFAHLARALYSIPTNLNHRIALITSFDHYRSQGMSFEEAYRKADWTNHLVNMSGGKANRPLLISNLQGPVARTAGMAMYSLQSYTAGVMGSLVRYAKGWKHGQTPVARRQSRDAFLLLAGTQLAAAGILGLPGVAGAMAVAEKAFPELELNKRLRGALASLGGDDPALGSIIAETALHGLPNQVAGVDVGSRFALGNILGANEYNGFSTANFFGPTLSLIDNMAKGVGHTIAGDFGKAAQSFVPQGFKRMIELIRNDGEIRDYDGKLLYQPTVGEQIALGIGFTPAKVSMIRDAKKIMQQSQQVSRAQIQQFHGEVADLYQKGDVPGACRLLLERQKADPEYDPRAGLRAVVDLVTNRTLPVDIRRMGTRNSADDDAAILRTYLQTGVPPSELQRLQLKKQIEMQFGLIGGGMTTPTEYQSALLTDQLLSSDPTMTLASAKSRVSELLRPRRRPAF